MWLGPYLFQHDNSTVHKQDTWFAKMEELEWPAHMTSTQLNTLLTLLWMNGRKISTGTFQNQAESSTAGTSFKT